MIEQFFDLHSILIYFLGFITFLATTLDDILNPKKRTKKYVWYFREFLYTVISITLGISFCYTFETSEAVCNIVTIIAGLFGSTFIHKFRLAKDDLAETAVKSTKKKIEKTIAGMKLSDNDDTCDESEDED